MQNPLRRCLLSTRMLGWIGTVGCLLGTLLSPHGSSAEQTTDIQSTADDSLVDSLLPPQSDKLAGWQWRNSDSSTAMLRGDQVVWQFNHGQALDKPYFHPLATVSGQVMTWDRPADHVWHHGLWFSWKYINGVNYWELNQETGKPDGRTICSNVRVETSLGHAARISMDVCYRPAAAETPVLNERRRISITSPTANEGYSIDWISEFTAVGDVILDRTPPQEQSWGGYAGLSVRFAEKFTERRAVSSEGAVPFDSGHRYRGPSRFMDYSGIIDGTSVGLAFFDHPRNPRHPTPWYLIRSREMSYLNAALLNNEPMHLKAAEPLVLRYRLVVHVDRWDARRLEAAYTEYSQSPVLLPHD